MAVISPCPGCMMGKHEEHKANWYTKPRLIDGAYCDCTGNCTLYKPGWLDDEIKRAQHRNTNRFTPAEKAWQEGFQAGLWYGKGGEITTNPYQYKDET